MRRDWFKSSYSYGANTDCVEASFAPGLRRLRDSKHPDGTVLALSPGAYRAFIAALKSR